MHVVYNASTIRQTGDTANLNGNIGNGYIYDVENRLLQAGSGMPQYGYDAGNKRVWRGQSSPALDEFTFWSGNQKWATYSIAVSGSTMYFTLTGTNVYFGGRMIAKGTYNAGGSNDKVTLASIAQDRLGSMNGKFYPYGQERPSATANDKEKFTGYFRDAATGLDYADQRYHNPGQGRFTTSDPLEGSAKTTHPGSWNRYAYSLGDPINNLDPKGMSCEFAGYSPSDVCDLNAIGSFGIPSSSDPNLGTNYYVDGVYTESSLTSSILNSGAAAVCPNNFCSGFVNDGNGTTFYQYQSYANGTSGYVGLTDTSVDPSTYHNESGSQPDSSDVTIPSLQDSFLADNRPQIGPDNGTAKPSVPPAPAYCSAYQQDGTGAGGILYNLCMSFPNNGWSNCVRARLLSQYPPNPNPMQLFWYLVPDHAWDFGACLVG
jgi:RHS repeat-associated protein